MLASAWQLGNGVDTALPRASGLSPEPLPWLAGPGCGEVGQRGTATQQFSRHLLPGFKDTQEEHRAVLSSQRMGVGIWGGMGCQSTLRSQSLRTGRRCVHWAEGRCGL